MQPIVTLKQSLLMDSDQISKLGDTINTKHGPLTYIDNGADVLAVCHRDTVLWNEKPKVGKRWIRNCPQLDDRLGLYCLLNYLPRIDCPKFDVLITDSEETGNSTAQFFDAPKDYRYMFEIDRNGADAVFYQFSNPLFEDYIASKWDIGWGSFTDICYLEHLKIMGVNLGAGYFNAHSKDCYADLNLTRTICQKWADMMPKLEGATFPDMPKNETIKGFDDKWWDTEYDEYEDYCQNCAESIEDTWNFCPNCGVELFQNFLPKENDIYGSRF